MSSSRGWRLLSTSSTLAALLALASCGETSREAVANATGGRPASEGGTATGGASGGSKPSRGGSAGFDSGGAPGGSPGQGGEAGAPIATDLDAIIGESFVDSAPCPLLRGVPTDCPRWTFYFRAADLGQLELIAYPNPPLLDARGATISFARVERSAYAWRLAEKLTLSDSPNTASEFQLGDLRFQFYDQDGDHRADALSVVGEGEGIVLGDDFSERSLLEFSFYGLPDRKSPTLAATASASPAQIARFAASEPLAYGSHATLTIGSEVAVLQPENDRGVVRGFWSPWLLLPNSEGELHIEGSDLAGNPIDARSQVSTSSIPTAAAADFESDAPFFATEPQLPWARDAQSGPRESYDALTALEGQRSFLVGWCNQVLLHVKRPPNTSTLRFLLRVLSWNAPVGPTIEVLVVGGVQIDGSMQTPPLFDDGGLPPGATPLLSGQALDPEPFATESEELVFTLNNAGEDVLVNIDAPCLEASESFAVGAWLDDLRFE